MVGWMKVRGCWDGGLVVRGGSKLEMESGWRINGIGESRR